MILKGYLLVEQKPNVKQIELRLVLFVISLFFCILLIKLIINI